MNYKIFIIGIGTKILVKCGCIKKLLIVIKTLFILEGIWFLMKIRKSLEKIDKNYIGWSIIGSLLHSLSYKSFKGLYWLYYIIPVGSGWLYKYETSQTGTVRLKLLLRYIRDTRLSIWSDLRYRPDR